MSTQTQTLGLTLPAWEEGFDLDDWNGNSLIIDTFAGQITAQVAAKVSPGDLAAVATSGSYNDLTGKPELAAVATSGDYSDLENKPTTDAAPTENSTNAVQSGGVFTALSTAATATLTRGTLVNATSDAHVSVHDLPVGRHYAGASIIGYIDDLPPDISTGIQITVEELQLTNRYIITIVCNSNSLAGVVYKQWYTQAGWSAWYKFTGEAVV